MHPSRPQLLGLALEILLRRRLIATRIGVQQIYLCGGNRFEDIFPVAVVAEGRFPRRRRPKTDLAGPRADAAGSKNGRRRRGKRTRRLRAPPPRRAPAPRRGSKARNCRQKTAPAPPGGGLRRPGSRVSAGAALPNTNKSAETVVTVEVSRLLPFGCAPGSAGVGLFLDS